MDEQALWERYLEVERRELEDRKNGELAKVLGEALPGESREELDRMAAEDRQRAEKDLVELRRGDEVWFKHIDELTREDRQARIEAQRRRIDWIQERLRKTSQGRAQPSGGE